ncbi:succinyl-CoA synthetase subunit alpha [Shewanella sairae]|uniref:Succinyl-CoA synthetase subunit alpha n=1 Tax=Shewanella sairae TaxID=190310 RepID=A0ABQ4PM96_9GAMM|nr:endonuclease/exonuclease/phosphatase family protein [Shewanella sairae]MCL1129975.1 endonuclease/exonuclease/phosphatase family protein [Shewanella sairae]GIU49335.1 succinyl-CoA synthetase subunit alpha [Shewanella sairae]
MKLLKTAAALAVGVALLTGCNDDDVKYVDHTEVKIATYNLSFDRNTFEDLVAEMALTSAQQTALVETYLEDRDAMAPADKTTAEKVIQIRNVAAIIQKTRPDVLMMGEYNNDGTGEDLSALKGFQTNYLSVAQSLDGAGGEANLEPIEYPFAESYGTNTGRLSGFDLNNDGYVAKKEDVNSFNYANDSWGFGKYHGQYAFALMSKYEIDTKNTRTFQNFKWKDLEGAENPFLDGENWYTDEEWQLMTLSSKNHVDAPILVPTKDGTETIHILMSHPTPPVFDTGKNLLQNAAEVEFWHSYVTNAQDFYDDAGKTGALTEGAHFVIVGDQNLDAATGAGDGMTEVMAALHADPVVNQNVTNGDLYPTSYGAAEYAVEGSPNHPYPNRITAEFGSGGINADHAIPSASLNIVDSGVYWQATYEEGRLLFNDDRIGGGKKKDISSDHRMVWVKAQF